MDTLIFVVHYWDLGSFTTVRLYNQSCILYKERHRGEKMYHTKGWLVSQSRQHILNVSVSPNMADGGRSDAPAASIQTAGHSPRRLIISVRYNGVHFLREIGKN